MCVRGTCVLVFAAVLACSRPALAQQTCPCPPPEPPPGNWVGSAGLGFALNRGNTDTTNLNVTFDATHDAKRAAKQRTQGNPMAAGLVALGAGWLVGSLLPASTSPDTIGGTLKPRVERLVEMTSASGLGFADALEYLHAQLTLAFSTEDIQEGVKAFFEKREPVWTGR